MQPFDDLSPAEIDPQNEEVIAFLHQVHGIPARAEPDLEQQTLALARVRQRLLEAQPEQFATFTVSSPESDLRLVGVDEVRSLPSQTNVALVRKRGWSHRFSVIAAVLAATLVVGSMLAVFVLANFIQAKRSQSVATSGSSPSSAIYALSGGGWLQKMDAQDGALLWKYQVPTNEQHRYALAVSNDVVAIVGQQEVVALRARDGALLWSEKLDGVVAIPPVIENNRVYLLLWKDMQQYDNHGSLEAFDVLSGHMLWHYDGPLFPSFAVTNDMVYGGLDFSKAGPNGVIPNFDRFALRAADGTQQWRVHFDNPSQFSAPVSMSVADGKVYMKTTPEGSDESVFAYNASNGAFLWRSPALPNLYQMGMSLVAQETLYTPFQKGIYALNEQNGKLLWSHSSKVSSGVSFALNDGKIFGTENDGSGQSIIELDASNGKLIAQHSIEGSVALSNGNGLKSADLVSGNATYVISPEGNLDAFDNQTGIRLWSVSMKAIEATPGIELVAGV